MTHIIPNIILLLAIFIFLIIHLPRSFTSIHLLPLLKKPTIPCIFYGIIKVNHDQMQSIYQFFILIDIVVQSITVTHPSKGCVTVFALLPSAGTKISRSN